MILSFYHLIAKGGDEGGGVKGVRHVRLTVTLSLNSLESARNAPPQPATMQSNSNVISCDGPWLCKAPVKETGIVRPIRCC